MVPPVIRATFIIVTLPVLESVMWLPALIKLVRLNSSVNHSAVGGFTADLGCGLTENSYVEIYFKLISKLSTVAQI